MALMPVHVSACVRGVRGLLHRITAANAAGTEQGTGVLTVQVLLLGPAHFVGGGLAHRLADGRAGHTVLRRGDAIRDRLA